MNAREGRPGDTPLITVEIAREVDIVQARQRARQVARAVGFGHQDQVRIATAVSEIARNAFQYATRGRVEISLARGDRPALRVDVTDNGPGIPDVPAVLEGRYQSSTGMGIGLSGTQRLMDFFALDSRPGEGTAVRFEKRLPPLSSAPVDVSGLIADIAMTRPGDAWDELQRQNTELLEMLTAVHRRETELDRRQDELQRLNLELEETNRGVVALYAELDEKAAELRRANELKSRFLSHVSHEFRTPLNSILALTQLLLRHVDGGLEAEQEVQVGYIRQAAQELAEMVNDLLDLAKVEAGKTEIRSTIIDVAHLFGALRGLMRPLAINDAVSLVFDEPASGLRLQSDEAKVTQILRNLISNALKFTERGEVRITARADAGQVVFTVRDTGIGIAPEHQDRIFQEFAQLDSHIQQRVKGTGLGLPLSRKLAILLGGILEVQSEPGEGSTFRLTLPSGVAEPRQDQTGAALTQRPILIVDDDEAARYVARHLFRGSPFTVIEASMALEAAERARFDQPSLILLDLAMPGRSGFEILEELKSDPSTRDIPVVIHTSRQLTPADYNRLGGRHAAILHKGGHDRSDALEAIRRILGHGELFQDETGSKDGEDTTP